MKELPLAVVLTLLAALPSYFNLATDQIFEEEKSLLLRAGALIALPAVIALWRSDMRRIARDPIVAVFGALIAVLTIATMFATVPHEALWGAHLRRHGLVNWIAVAVLFAAMLPAARAAAGRDLIVRALIIGAVWPSIYILMQEAAFDPIQWIAPSQGFKPGGTFGNHVMLGGYLAIAIPLTALEAWRSHRGWIALLLLELVAVIATSSRGAALAVMASAGVGGIAWLRDKRPRMALGAAVIGVVVAVGLIAPQFNRSEGSARVRILIWQDTIDVMRHAGARSFFGYGPESLKSVFPRHYSPEIGRWEQIDAMPDRAHNEALDMLVSAGLAGAILELALFAVMLMAALRIKDVALRCALAASAVAHIVEIQFGIASATTRLCFLAIAALVVGVRAPHVEQRLRRAPYGWIAAAALLGAASPWLSLVPSIVNNPITSGGEAEFIAYLRSQSIAIPAIYFALASVALGMARSISPRSGIGSSRVVMLAAGAWAAIVLCIEPSRTDAFTAAGRTYEGQQRWPEATLAFGAAARDQLDIPDYQSDLGRASIQWALQSESPLKERLLDQGRAALQRAVDLNPFDPETRRRLAAYPRIRAALSQGAERDALLQQADRAYADLRELAPTSPPVWVESAWVDVDRGRTDEAKKKLAIALSLDDRHPAALALRGRLQ